MRPTRGVPLVLVLAAVLHQLAQVDHVAWLALASAACLALPLAALVLRPRLADLRVTSEPVRTRVGWEVEQRLTIRNTGRRRSSLLRLTDSTPGLSRVVLAVPALPPGGELTAVVRRTALVRGECSAGLADLVSTAPLGLLRVCRSVPVPGPFSVAPRPVAAGRLADAGRGTSGSPRQVVGAGTEVLGLRAWRPGDGVGAVSARASARHGRPVVLEREREGGSRLVVLCTAAGAGPAWERVVERSCALAEDHLRRGHTVLLADGPPAPVRAGDVLDWHARLDGSAPVDAHAGAVARAVATAGAGGALLLLATAAQDTAAQDTLAQDTLAQDTAARGSTAPDTGAVRALCLRARVALTVLQEE